jgi:hypothetical protein
MALEQDPTPGDNPYRSPTEFDVRAERARRRMKNALLAFGVFVVLALAYLGISIAMELFNEWVIR